MWPADKVQRLLGPSAVVGEIAEYQRHRRATYDQMASIDLIRSFFEKEAAAPAPARGDDPSPREGGSVFTYANFVWAQTILDSRSIWWDGARHLVPMLDFINCQSGPEDALLDSEGTVHSTTMEGDAAATRAEAPGRRDAQHALARKRIDVRPRSRRR